MIQSLAAGFAAAATSLNKAAKRGNHRSQDEFILENFFSGKTVAHARFAAINGLTRKFRIDITGIYDGNTLRLHEEFLFDDGETDTKTWHFRKIADGKYMAHREDMLKPVEAILRNGTLRYTYLIYLDSANQSNVVRFRDRISMIDKRTLKNTAIIFKYGIPVGKVTATFQKQD